MFKNAAKRNKPGKARFFFCSFDTMCYNYPVFLSISRMIAEVLKETIYNSCAKGVVREVFTL
ncbi:hypothetical protein Cst_c22830 [Thermoclostridium stercorarium subsp. stercorarium DSM 8532]|uniref:Uncharacterized protein n=1 Tax=Thermoclostridium stercorarium (strain ATCC 35414 / DSM 8532 / NCIMB 11754) TaxID=1121335 RepID=L7VUI6_THES1|nr:hypothetical protein Cst_c22830 [Thermoclostridium stercorarium subsp. stercorarium DSM 8532]